MTPSPSRWLRARRARRKTPCSCQSAPALLFLAGQWSPATAHLPWRVFMVLQYRGQRWRRSRGSPSVEQLQLRFSLTDGGDDVVWWEDTCNMYEIIAPSSFASQHTCQGIRRGHFKPAAAAAFRRKVEAAKGERAWLDVDADRVLDERAVTLSQRVQGILSYSLVPQARGEFASLSLRHYLLLSSVDLRACNAGFHDMRCTSDATTLERPLFKGTSAGTPPPVRCDYCQWLFEGVAQDLA